MKPAGDSFVTGRFSVWFTDSLTGSSGMPHPGTTAPAGIPAPQLGYGPESAAGLRDGAGMSRNGRECRPGSPACRHILPLLRRPYCQMPR